MKRLYSILIAMTMLVIFVPAAALAKGAAGFPTWSQHLTKGRFTVLPLFNSDAVFDKETGLVWEKTPGTTTRNWLSAQSHCNTKVVGDRRGWRLPTLQELASLVDAGNVSPALPVGYPFTLTIAQEDGFYWSATTRAVDTSLAWDVGFGFGVVSSFAKADVDFVWCVRGGQGVDPQ